MRARLRAWWQKIKQYRLLPLGGIVVLLTFTLVVWRFGWDWTGFNGGYSQITTTSISHGTTTTTEKPPGKTLWDLLQLLIIPLMLASGGFWLNQLQKSREEKAIEQQAEVERKAAEKRAQTEREIASDNQREAALQDYIDKMSELLLKEHLRESGAEARKIARVRTLAVLPRLDGKRKRTLLLFLYESNLIARDKPSIELTRNKTNELTRELSRDNSMLASIKDKSIIESIELTKDESIIELKGADLSEADLERTNLGKANLREANLSGANLRGANLRKANLEKANLRAAYLRAAYLRAVYLRAAYLQDADLRGADLERANLEKANLRRANLRAAYLRGTNLQDADLREADLSEADLERANLYTADLSGANLEAVTGITIEELEKKASSLKGATLPDGSKHP